MPDRFYRATHQPPTWWENSLTQYALVLWMIEWVGRAVIGAATAIASSVQTTTVNLVWISYLISSGALAVGAVLVLIATIVPLAATSDLAKIWNLYSAGFLFAGAGWIGYGTHNLIYAPAPQWGWVIPVNLALCVVGWVTIRLRKRATRSAIARFDELKREVAS